MFSKTSTLQVLKTLSIIEVRLATRVKIQKMKTKKEETNADTPKKDAVPLIKNGAKSKLTLADLLEVFDGVMEMKVNT